MKFFLISDNIDTQMGMRLAGIEGVVAHTENEATAALEQAISDDSIAIILVTEKLVEICRKRVYEIKLGLERPLIVAIPDRHGNSGISDAISRYVEESIGIKL